jgi:hypothetical protein
MSPPRLTVGHDIKVTVVGMTIDGPPLPDLLQLAGGATAAALRGRACGEAAPPMPKSPNLG